MKQIFFIASSVLLGGCASVQVYTPPSVNESQAKLIIPVFKTEHKGFGGLSGGEVQIAAQEKDGCGNLKSIETKGVDKDFQIKIPAPGKVFISAFRYQGNSQCRIVASFNPKDNRSYEFKFNFIDQHCAGSVVEKQDDNKELPVKLEKAFASTWSGIKVCDSESKL